MNEVTRNIVEQTVVMLGYVASIGNLGDDS